MTIGEEFIEHAAILRSLHFGEATGRLRGLIDWMDAQPPLRNILVALRRKADGPAILRNASFHYPPKANTPDEVAAVGLALMEACREEDFATLCYGRGIGPGYSTSSVQSNVDAAMERYIGPLLVHVGRELDCVDADYVPSRIAERKFDEILLGKSFAEHFPKTHQQLSRIAGEFTRIDAAWDNVANSCRQAMLAFCGECCAFLSLEPPNETKRGAIKPLMRLVVRKLYGTGQTADALEDLISSAWDYAQPLTHRSTATREEALRLYLWTGLTIDEIATLAIEAR